MELIVTAITIVSNSIVALLAFTRANKSRTLKWFIVFVLSLITWSIANYFSLTSVSETDTLFWIRAVLLITIPLGGSLVMFSNYYPENSSLISKKLKYFILAYSVGLSILVLTKFVVSGVTIGDSISPSFEAGMIFYVIFLLSTLLGTFTLLLRKFKNSKGLERQKIGYLFLGVALTTVLAVITNLIFVIFLNLTNFVVFGPLFTIIFVGTTLYSIIRHRLFDIRFLLGKLTYYVSLSIISFSAFQLAITLITYLFSNVYNVGAYAIVASIAFAFVISFNSFNNFIRKSIDSRLINPGYDPLETVDDLGNELSVALSTTDISNKVLSTISRTIRPAYETLVVLPQKDQGEPTVLEYKDHNSNITTKTFDEAISIWKKTGIEPIVVDEIDQELLTRYSDNTKDIKSVEREMKEVKTKVLLPLGQTDEIKGILVIGEKEADNPYTVQDINFLKSLANTTRVAVERALFYEEVVELNRTLQKRVDEATKELRTRNKDLQNAYGQIKEAQRRERDMIDIMGHELRTPITIVRNALSLLNQSVESKKEIPEDILEKYVKMANESAEREITLIETLLSATKIDADRLQLFREDVDFLDVVDDSMLALKGRAERKGIKVKFEKPEKLSGVYVDRTRIQEVVDNLLSNAIKYTNQGSVEIKVSEEGDLIKCAISDSGIGIPKDELKHLGKKFYRVGSNSGNRAKEIVRPGGTGLGLYVTYEIVKGHGGKVDVKSEVGKGSTFSFTVPKYTDQKIEKAEHTKEKDLFKRLGKKTKAQEAGEKKKPRRREIAD